MGIIGDQIRDYLDAHPDDFGRPMSAAIFAALVTQASPAKKTTRQNIDQLLDHVELPRSVATIQGIAAVLGKTVDDLLSGRPAGASPLIPLPPPREPQLPAALRLLASAVAKLPPRRRKVAGQVLALLAEEPQQAGESVDILLSLLTPPGAPKGKPQSA